MGLLCEGRYSCAIVTTEAQGKDVMRYSRDTKKQEQGQQMIEYILLSIAVVMVVIFFISRGGPKSYRETLNGNLNAVGKMMAVKQLQISQ